MRNKISKNVGIVSKVMHLLPQDLTRNLYLTLVNAYICYCNLVWSSPEQSTSLNKIFKIKKKYVRLITFSNFREHSRPLFQQLLILSVYDTFKYQLLIHVYKSLNNLIPNSNHYYTLNSAIHNIFVFIIFVYYSACARGHKSVFEFNQSGIQIYVRFDKAKV